MKEIPLPNKKAPRPLKLRSTPHHPIYQSSQLALPGQWTLGTASDIDPSTGPPPT
ncbi:hypothetical protein A2U01_0117746, partial [Trifolium medium]|nr:hypothetical protein [Trifolium medium]